jgi:hypothetical protein
VKYACAIFKSVVLTFSGHNRALAKWLSYAKSSVQTGKTVFSPFLLIISFILKKYSLVSFQGLPGGAACKVRGQRCHRY